MFTNSDFDNLYKMLDLAMVTEDCGVKCGKFCCVSQDGKVDKTFRYLLPAEVDFLVANNFHHYNDLEDFIFVIRYVSKDPNSCGCEKVRDYRPFCCRMFPFRPIIDENLCQVTAITKVSDSYFTPCWITEVLPEWQQAAIKAWNYVLSDRDNLIFYTQCYFSLKKGESFSGSFLEAMTVDEEFREQIFNIPNLSNTILWENTNKFFQYIL